MESIPYPPIEYEKPEKEPSMTNENTEKTLGENIAKNKKEFSEVRESWTTGFPC